jgi:exopolysaccharide production protein ExoZ
MRAREYPSIQVLRGIAAGMVLVFHAMTACDMVTWQSFNQGVEIFFCISGFVMYISNAGKPGGLTSAVIFLRRRIIRVVPLHWLFLSLYILEISPVFRGSSGMPPYQDILKSYLYLKIYWPVLTVGWTLSFELFFYLCFATMLAFEVSVFWLIIPFVGFVAIDHYALFSPRLVCFLAGMIIGKLAYMGRYLPRPIAISICVAFAIAILRLRGNELWTWYWLPTTLSCLLIAAMVALEPNVKLLHSGFLLLLGDASYTLYLSHILILHVFAGLGRHGYPLTGLFWMIFAVAVCSAIAICLHKLVEKPLVNWLNQRVGGRRSILAR